MKTLEEWKAKYYPVEASEVPEYQALDHSILKWEGLQPEVLKEYGAQRRDAKAVHFMDQGKKWRMENTCALCHHHSEEELGCPDCPISKVHGKTCVRTFWHGTAADMLKLLKETKEGLK